MPSLSAFFTIEELTDSQIAARKGIDNMPDVDILCNLQRTAMRLDEVRKLLGKPIIVSSGYRSPALNKTIGGSATSDHMTGNAVDFICPAFGSPQQVFDRIKHSGIKFDQLICELGRWVHIGFGAKNRGQCLSYDGDRYSEVK